jgi:hypothetical protein
MRPGCTAFAAAALFATVESAQLRGQQTINRNCAKLELLGDTLGVVVNLQNSAAPTGRELTTLAATASWRPVSAC